MNVMQVNKKKPICMKNRTKYFSADSVRTKVRFSSSDSYSNRDIKIQGYETRLYWQFEYCKSVGGQTFFYTLTYNDKALPNHYGINCFDYEDLRDLLTGGFRKMLLRKYGTVFKYFVGAELGDGKGKRGMHNNPHYHLLFFLEPDPDAKFPYIRIAPEDFRHLVRLYWQGFDEDVDGFRDYNEALYGIAREGEDCGLVSDYRACVYCAKYVCKDVKLKMHEAEVERRSRYVLRRKFKKSDEVYEGFFRDVINPMYNTPLNPSKTEWSFTEHQLIEMLLGTNWDVVRDIFGDVPDTHFAWWNVVPAICRDYHLWQKFYEYLDSFVADKVQEAVCEWRNRYSNKTRISQGVGIYGLSNVRDVMNPSIPFPTKNGFKNRPLPLYYYRKLFTDVCHTGFSDKRGNEIICYVLNDLGIKYKMARLDKQLESKAEQAVCDFQIIVNDKDIYDKMLASDVNTEVSMSHSEFIKFCQAFIHNEKSPFQLYAIYKLVYEDRFFKVPSLASGESCDFPILDYHRDYQRFLKPSIYSIRRNDLMLDSFLDSGCQGYLPYLQHPDFLRYSSLFSVLDLCADYFFVTEDDRRQKLAEEIAATRRFHNQEVLMSFYSNFN